LEELQHTPSRRGALKYFNFIHRKNTFYQEVMAFAGRIYEVVLEKGLWDVFEKITKDGECEWPFHDKLVTLGE
jgi:hypothetical protein